LAQDASRTIDRLKGETEDRRRERWEYNQRMFNRLLCFEIEIVITAFLSAKLVLYFLILFMNTNLLMTMSDPIINSVKD
jgi:hypothetical protein